MKVFEKYLIRDTKYIKMYFDIICKALKENRVKTKSKKYENHHIVPKCIAPRLDNEKYHPDNFVLLTPREHFIAHLLLWKHYKKIGHKDYEIKTYYPIRFFSEDGRYNSKMYEYFKNNSPLKGKPLSEEHRKKLSEAQKGRVVSDETKRKLSEIHKGKEFTQEHKDNISRARKDTVLCYDKKKNINKIISKDEFDNNPERYLSVNKDMVVAIDTDTDEVVRIHKDEFKNNKKYIGLMYNKLCGIKNGRAKKIILFTPDNDVHTIFEGNLRSKCKEIGIRIGDVVDSHKKGEPINYKRGKYLKWNGFYAIEV